MDINDLRKQIFINSQYCNFYNEKNGTVLAGIMRSYGYKYSIILPDEKIKEVNKTYRKFTAIMNALVAVEIILYIYTVIFPYYTEFIKMPYFGAVMMLAVIPLVALYLTYIAVNYLYENYLTRYVGTFQKTKFKPELKNDILSVLYKTNISAYNDSMQPLVYKDIRKALKAILKF